MSSAKIQQSDGSPRRIRKFFPTRQEAEIFVGEQKDKLTKHGHTSVSLNEDDRILFQQARDRLTRSGASITQAVDYFLAHHREVKERLPLRELITRCVLEKDLAGARKRYLQTFTCSCRSFARGREEQTADTVTRDEVKAWILGNGFAPKTQRNYLGDVRELFAWGVRERYHEHESACGRNRVHPARAN